MKLSDLPPEPPKILIYGGAGSGKTALALTLGEDCEYLNLDNNIRVGTAIHDSLREERLKVEIKNFLETDPKKACVFKQVKSRIFSIADECLKNTYPYHVVVVDSLTAFSEASMREVQANSGHIGRSPEIQEYGLAFMQTKQVIDALRGIPLPVILLAHDQNSDIKGQIELAIQGKNMPNEVPRYFGEFWYLRVRSKGGSKREHYIQTVPTGVATARSTSGLTNEFVFAEVDGDKTTRSVGLWEIIEKMGYKRPALVKGK